MSELIGTVIGVVSGLALVGAAWAMVARVRSLNRRRAAQLEHLCSKLDEVLPALEASRKREHEVRETIQSCLDQRNHWKQLYFQQVTEHGAAQALLLRSVGRYERYTESLRASVRVAKSIEEAKAAAARPCDVNRPLLRQIATEFAETHGPAMEPEQLNRLLAAAKPLDTPPPPG